MFYNPAMGCDRDLAVSFARAWSEVHPGAGRGWEMLAATGVRGLRILNESSLLASLLVTEGNPDALSVLSANAERYRDRGAHVRRHDARRLPSEAPFDYVDLDPYGSPLPFLACALRSVVPGGLLAVTATDMMVLAGVVPGSCERLYGARPVRGRLAPEAALRILVGVLERRARDSGRAIVPRLGYVGDHHVRTVVTVEEHSPRRGEPVACLDPSVFPGPWLAGRGPFGPMWIGSLFDPSLIAKMSVPDTAATPRETQRALDLFRGEATIDAPFTFEPNELARRLRLPSPPRRAALIERLGASGWAAARSHVRPSAFRTSAPRTVVEAIAVALSSPQSQNARVRA